MSTKKFFDTFFYNRVNNIDDTRSDINIKLKIIFYVQIQSFYD